MCVEACGDIVDVPSCFDMLSAPCASESNSLGLENVYVDLLQKFVPLPQQQFGSVVNSKSAETGQPTLFGEVLPEVRRADDAFIWRLCRLLIHCV